MTELRKVKDPSKKRWKRTPKSRKSSFRPCLVRFCKKRPYSNGLCREHWLAENPGADMYYLSHEDRKKFRAYMEQQMRWVEDAEAYGLDLLSIIKKLRYGGQMTKGEWACYFEAERFFDGFKRDFHAEFEKLWDELEMGVY